MERKEVILEEVVEKEEITENDYLIDMMLIRCSGNIRYNIN